LDEERGEWELTMFKTPQAEAFLIRGHPQKSPRSMDASS